MKSWADAEQQVTRLVADITKPDDSIDEHLLRHCKIAHERACFLTYGLRNLRGLANTLPWTLQNSGVVPEGEAPGTMLITSIINLTPSSLQSILKTVDAIAALRDSEKPMFGAVKETRDRFKRWFPHPDVLEPGSIISSLRVVDMEVAEHARRRVNPQSDLAQFSYDILKDTVIPAHRRRNLLTLLKQGYPLKQKGAYGKYKVTRFTAQALHDGLIATSGGKDVPDFDTFAPVDALAGLRNGKSSRALDHRDGNLISPTF